MEIAELRAENASFLADCIEGAGPQHGEHVTNAIPGLSWHQWGEAVDCFWVVDNKAVWDSEILINGINGFAIYAEKAKKLGLNAGMYWDFQDTPHVRNEGAALKLPQGGAPP